jgi:hypothetical protein
LGFDVQLWTDRDYRLEVDIIESTKVQVEAISKNDLETLENLHNERQQEFIGQCLRHHKATGRSWVALVDTDEFIAFNSVYGGDSSMTAAEQRRLPSTHETTVADFMNFNESLFDDMPCLGMTRTLFGPKLATEQELRKAELPQGFDPEDFNTLKYFHHDKIGAESMNGYLKVMMDVRQLSEESLHPTKIDSIHRPLIDICPEIDSYFSVENDATSVFRVHHYLGTWEEYSFRSDARRSNDIFTQKAEAASRYGPNYEIRPWLNTFIQTEGIEKAQQLLVEGASSTPKAAKEEKRRRTKDKMTTATKAPSSKGKAGTKAPSTKSTKASKKTKAPSTTKAPSSKGKAGTKAPSTKSTKVSKKTKAPSTTKAPSSKGQAGTKAPSTKSTKVSKKTKPPSTTKAPSVKGKGMKREKAIVRSQERLWGW